MKILHITFLICIISFAQSKSFIKPIQDVKEEALEAQFYKFVKDYNREYASQQEMEVRKQAFIHNMKRAEELSRLNPHATFGVNEFADQTQEEEMMMAMQKDFYFQDGVVETHTKESDALSDIDFRDIMQPVQSGIINCASSWSYAASAAFEARLRISSGGLTSYKTSEQEAIDCIPDAGCESGSPSQVFDYFKNNKACTQESYPKGEGKEECQIDSCSGVSNDKGYKKIAKKEAALYDALTEGPITVFADSDVWNTYTGGVLTECPSGSLYSYATIVGYEAESNSWILRTDRGANWGENGHIRLAYGANTCDITSDALYPTF